jgi:glycosyltransferase involved in cell wall biosynthesis
MIRLAIISSHPIQYNAPLFKRLASQAGLVVKVFYTLGGDFSELKDKGFGKAINWDIPILEGYEYQFLKNSSKKPGTSVSDGIINPFIINDIKSFKPTAILVYGWNFKSHLKVIRYFKGKVKILFRGDSTLLNEKKGFKKIIRRVVLTWVYKHIDKALYVGINNKQYYQKHGLKDAELVFAPHAIDNIRYGNDDLYLDEAKVLRSELKVPSENILFAFIGKYENVKNPLILMEAFKRLESDRVSLLFVGNGHLEEELKRKAAGSQNIHFLPFQNQKIMPVIYRIADVYVLPSVSETWGLAVNEAMACGLPVIVSSKVGCAPDLVQDMKNGYIFESGNTEDLYRILSIYSVKTTVELKEMGRVSKKIIENWNYERTSDAIVESIRSKV